MNTKTTYQVFMIRTSLIRDIPFPEVELKIPLIMKFSESLGATKFQTKLLIITILTTPNNL